MAKQIKKQHNKPKKINKWQRVCERCGNENFSLEKVFKCKYCWFWNGVDNETIWKKAGRMHDMDGIYREQEG